MKRSKLIGLISVMLLAFAMILGSCGEKAPEFPPAELADELGYGYAIGVPDYFSSNGFVYDDKSRLRVSDIADQAVLSIGWNLFDPSRDEFDGDLLAVFSDKTGLDTTEYTTEEAEIAGAAGMKISGTDPDGNEVRALAFPDDDHGCVIIVCLKEYTNETEKEHGYLSDFDLIADSVQKIGPEEYFARLGYTIDFPDYYEKFTPVDRAMERGYACYSNPDSNIDMTMKYGAGSDSLDKELAGLEDSLFFDDSNPVKVSTADEITTGPARIVKYSYSYSGMDAGGSGAYIYDTDKDILININLMESGRDSELYNGDFEKMIDGISVAGE